MRRLIEMKRWMLGILSTTVLAALGAAAHASTIPIFEDTGTLLGAGIVGNVHSFNVSSAGFYQAALVDFSIPEPINDITFSVFSTSAYKGRTAGPGSLGFKATAPGRHFISVFGVTGPSGVGRYGIEVSAMPSAAAAGAPLPAVPLPPAVLLFAGSLAALAAVGRRARVEAAPRETEASPDTSV